jgi:hypothetical protein
MIELGPKVFVESFYFQDLVMESIDYAEPKYVVPKAPILSSSF